MVKITERGIFAYYSSYISVDFVLSMFVYTTVYISLSDWSQVTNNQYNATQ